MVNFLRKKRRELLLFGVFVGLILLLVSQMFSAGVSFRSMYSIPGEPKNAYMVHMMQKGVHNEFAYTDSLGNTYILTTAGMTGVVPTQIVVNDQTYFQNLSSTQVSGVYAQGIYCPSGVYNFRCLMLSTTTEGEFCPTALIYLGFYVPLYEKTCVVSK